MTEDNQMKLIEKEYYYRLEKLEIDKNAYSAVRAGYRQSGMLSTGDKDKNIQRDVDLDAVKEDVQVIVSGNYFGDFLVTSPVSKIIDKGESHVKFKTKTSTYMLTKHEK